MQEAQKENVLSVSKLHISFSSGSHCFDAVKNVSFSLHKGECMAIVGESGSGKSLTALALTRLLPAKGCMVRGEIYYKGKDVLSLGPKSLQRLRGKEIAYVFQEPGGVLNPSLTIGYQIQETLLTHFPEERQAKEKILDALETVKLSQPLRYFKSYPHELSGGQQQRAMIAMALVCKPSILIADEATTALDVITQKQILELLQSLKQTTHMAILFITHNLSLVRHFADTVLVLYKGQAVEQGPARSMLSRPQAPYTQALLQCIPKLGEKKPRLDTIASLA